MRKQIVEQQITQAQARLGQISHEADGYQAEIRKWHRAGDESKARRAEASLRSCLKKRDALAERIRMLRSELASLR